MFLCIHQPQQGEPYVSFSGSEEREEFEDEVILYIDLQMGDPGIAAFEAVCNLVCWSAIESHPYQTPQLEILLTTILRTGIRIGEKKS